MYSNVSSKRTLVYNTEQNRLLLPEYGRCLQKMVENIKILPTKEQRNNAVMALIPVLQRICPQLQEEGGKNKVWDMLSMLADFQLDVDYPCEPVAEERLESKPQRIAYPQSSIPYKQYGKNVMSMLERLKECESSQERQFYLSLILNHMKKSYLQWNGGVVEDDKIIQDLCELSNGEISPEDITFKLMNQKVIFEKKKKNNQPIKKGKKGKK